MMGLEVLLEAAYFLDYQAKLGECGSTSLPGDGGTKVLEWYHPLTSDQVVPALVPGTGDRFKVNDLVAVQEPLNLVLRDKGAQLVSVTAAVPVDYEAKNGDAKELFEQDYRVGTRAQGVVLSHIWNGSGNENYYGVDASASVERKETGGGHHDGSDKMVNLNDKCREFVGERLDAWLESEDFKKAALTMTAETSSSGPKAEVRMKHNSLERSRRSLLKDCFAHLQSKLGSSLQSKAKASNLDILKAALQEIHTLTKEESEHEAEVKRLKSLQASLEAQLTHETYGSAEPAKDVAHQLPLFKQDLQQKSIVMENNVLPRLICLESIASEEDEMYLNASTGESDTANDVGNFQQPLSSPVFAHPQDLQIDSDGFAVCAGRISK